MYESDDIIKYLADTYGDGTVPIMLSLGLLTVSNYMFRSIRYALAQHTHQSTSICPIKQLSKNKLHDLIECPIIQEYMARLFLSPYMLQFFFSNLAIQVLYYCRRDRIGVIDGWLYCIEASASIYKSTRLGVQCNPTGYVWQSGYNI